MSGFVLKMIACITMLIDHIAAVCLAPYCADPEILNIYKIMRGVGRIAFPIICFMLVEGFWHTSNRRKYMLRIAILAVISEVLYDLAFSDFCVINSAGEAVFSWDIAMLKQNTILSLLLGIVFMYLYEMLKAKYMLQPMIFNTLGVFAIIGATGLAYVLRVDYSYLGILFILAFYMFRGQIVFQGICMTTVICLFSTTLELPALFAFIPIFFYRDKGKPRYQYWFYAFYPIHLIVLILVKYFLLP